MTSQHALSDLEFDLLRQLLSVFRDGVQEISLEQKRAAVRTVVRKVVWDGVHAHVVLFGVPDNEIEYPPFPSGGSDPDGPIWMLEDPFCPFLHHNKTDGQTTASLTICAFSCIYGPFIHSRCTV